MALGVGPLADAGNDGPLGWAAPDGQRLTWERDDEHFPAALAPLMADYVELGVSAGWADAYASRGLPVLPQYRIVHGHAYTAIRVLPTQPGGPSASELVAARNRAAADGISRRWRVELRPRLLAIYGRLAGASEALRTGPSPGATWAQAWQDCRATWLIHFSVDGPAYRALADLLDAWVALPLEPPDADAVRVLRSRSGGMLALQRDLAALDRLARAAPGDWSEVSARPTPAQGAARATARTPLARALRSFLERHGHLGQTFIDLRLPSWAEQPGALVDVIARGLAGPPAEESFAARRTRLDRLADDTWARARRSLGSPREAAALDRVVRRARRAAWLTQEHCYWIDQMHPFLMRRLALAAGERLRAAGSIAGAEDVFLLRASEVEALLRGPDAVHALVDDRRVELERQTGLVAPPVLGGPDPADPDVAQPAEQPQVLRGESGSPGTGRGPARLIEEPPDLGLVQPGDVLVCRGSNPSWVPFMGLAAALVAESGGRLAHAAIIAREMGIPAVVGVVGALSRIAPGQPLEVDGSAGVVRLG